MTNPFAQPASSPFGQAPQFTQQAPVSMYPPAAPAQTLPPQAAPPILGAMSGLGTPAKRVLSNVSATGLRDYLLLIVPTAVQHGLLKPGSATGETQSRVTADVLVIRTPDGRTGPVTVTCMGAPGEPPRALTHHADADGNPDPNRPFIHDPAAGQFLAFQGMWIFGGILAEGLAPALDPNRPDVTMIAAYIRSKKGTSNRNYFLYEDPRPQDMDEIQRIGNAWLATRGQFG